MKSNRAKTIDYFVTEIMAGNLEFSDVRKKLNAEGVEEEEIRIIARVIDSELRNSAVVNERDNYGKGLFYSGLILSVFGAVLVILALTGSILSINTIALFGPLIAGITLTSIGKSQMKGR